MGDITYFSSQPNQHKLPYFNSLQDIRRRLVLNFETTKFPKGGAEISSIIVEKVLGFEKVEGIYIPTNQHHKWNHDQERELYVDLTLDQYGNFHPVTILPVSINMLKRENIDSIAINTPELDKLIDAIVQSILGK